MTLKVSTVYASADGPVPCCWQPMSEGGGPSAPSFRNVSPWVQVSNNHILSKILAYITTILNPST